MQIVFAPDMKDVMGIQRAADEGVAGLDLGAVADQDVGRCGNEVFPFLHVLPDDGDAFFV